MAGIYIHIPFCGSKCAYCAFYSTPNQRLKKSFLEALIAEIGLRKSYIEGEKIETLYFGGGTPSLLSPNEIGAVLVAISANYDLAKDAEITLEANPDTLSPEYLKAIRSIGINRLSIGIQSFFDEDLKYLCRKHDSQHAKDAVKWSKEAGFDNLTLDLIYGIPTLSDERWNQNLDLFFDTGIPHLSAYALTIEPNTILAKQIALGKALPVDEDASVSHYNILTKRAASEGFLHYEISNFCKPNFYSKHNRSYWNGTHYLGLGPAAHSFNGISRQWNLPSLEKYVQMTATSSESLFERETLSPEQHYDEYVMTSLRTMWGCDLKYMEREMGKRFSDYCLSHARKVIENGRLTKTNEFLYLTDSQMLFADGVAEELFWGD